MLTQRMRPPGLLSQIGTALLRPEVFFRTLPTFHDTRQWVWVALLILLLTGVTAVRQAALSNPTSVIQTPADTGGPPPGLDFGGKDGGGGGGGGNGAVTVLTRGGGPIPAGGGGNGGGTPPDGGIPTETASPADVSSAWVTALLAASGIVLSWVIQAVLLSEVSLFNGQRPRLGFNLQIAIWAALPLALMTIFQLLYYAAGGTVGQAGISGMLAHWHRYQEFPVFLQSVLLSLTSRLTLFWLWELVLLYLGARYTLNGRRWASLLVVVIWVVIIVVAPVITGAINAAPVSA
jgi:hypothetical protein